MKTYRVSIYRETEFVTEVEAEDVDVAVDLARLEANNNSMITSEQIEAEVTLR